MQAAYPNRLGRGCWVTGNRLGVVAGLLVIAGVVWMLDPKHRVDPYEDEVND